MQSHLACRSRFVHIAWIALSIMMICFVMTQELLAEVDTHRDWARFKPRTLGTGGTRILLFRTQEHMNSGVETFWKLGPRLEVQT